MFLLTAISTFLPFFYSKLADAIEKKATKRSQDAKWSGNPPPTPLPPKYVFLLQLTSTLSSKYKLFYHDIDLTKPERMSTGTGNTMVLFFSAEMLLRVCR